MRFSAIAAIVALPSVAHAEELTLDLGGGARLTLVRVPAGSFSQGSAPAARGHQVDEGQREVTISRPFWMGKTKVSVGEFRRFVEASGWKTEAEKGSSGGFGLRGGELVQDRAFSWRNPGFPQTDEHPVVLVTWGDAAAFARWLSTTTGREASLPTEAEWEYAARGGATTLFSWGDAEGGAATFARFADKPAGTRPGRESKANGFGLLDTAGNAWEWTSDFYGPIGPTAARDPAQTDGVTWAQSDKPRRALKGGSWHTKDVWKLRPAARHKATDGSRNADFGFRVRVSDQPPRPTSAVAPLPTAPGPAPAPPPKAESSPGCGFGFVAAVFGGITWLFVTAFLLARRGNRPSAPRGRGVGGSVYPVRLARDGFWIDAPAHASGQSVRYRALAGGKQVDGVMVLQAGPTFVFTGHAPQHAVITGRGPSPGGQPFDDGPDSGPDSGPGYVASDTSDAVSRGLLGHGTGWPGAY